MNTTPPPRRIRIANLSNMAAESSEAVEAVANADLVNALNIVEDLIHRIDSLNDPDCVEGISLRLDVLKRYFVNIGIDDITLQSGLDKRRFFSKKNLLFSFINKRRFFSNKRRFSEFENYDDIMTQYDVIHLYK